MYNVINNVYEEEEACRNTETYVYDKIEKTTNLLCDISESLDNKSIMIEDFLNNKNVHIKDDVRQAMDLLYKIKQDLNYAMNNSQF